MGFDLPVRLASAYLAKKKKSFAKPQRQEINVRLNRSTTA